MGRLLPRYRSVAPEGPEAAGAIIFPKMHTLLIIANELNSTNVYKPGTICRGDRVNPLDGRPV